MVWSTTQSALYNDLSRYYEDEKKVPNSQETAPEKFERNIREKTIDNRLENECEKTCDNECNIHPETDCDNSPKIEAETHSNFPNCPNCRYRQNNTQNPLSQLFSDKDMLLIAGLIFLLIKQGADKKLILALAFVLLS